MSSAANQAKVQKYMTKMKIQDLLESLMSSLIKEQPQEPLIFLMKILQQKATSIGVHVPLQVKIMIDEPKSTSPTKKKAVEVPSLTRSYDRPWLSTSQPSSNLALRPVRSSVKATSTIDKVEDIWHQGGRKGAREIEKNVPHHHPQLIKKNPICIDYSAPATATDNTDDDPLANEFRLPKATDCTFKENPVRVLLEQNSGSLSVKNASKKSRKHMSEKSKSEREILILEKLAEKNRKAEETLSKSALVNDRFTEEEPENNSLFNDESDEAPGSRLPNQQNRFAVVVPQPQVKVTICQNCAKIVYGDEQRSTIEDLLSEPENASAMEADDETDNDAVPYSSRSMFSEDIESASQVDGPRTLNWNDNPERSSSKPKRKRDPHSFGAKFPSGSGDTASITGRGWEIPNSSDTDASDQARRSRVYDSTRRY